MDGDMVEENVKALGLQTAIISAEALTCVSVDAHSRGNLFSQAILSVSHARGEKVCCRTTGLNEQQYLTVHLPVYCSLYRLKEIF